MFLEEVKKEQAAGTQPQQGQSQEREPAVQKEEKKKEVQSHERSGEREKKGGEREREVRGEEEEKKELDFSQLNQKFTKISLDNNEANKFGKYDKTAGFFDSISNSTQEKVRETKEQRQKQANIDKETFGTDY